MSRRWTLLLISHDSESPKSISVTDRALRLAATLGVVVLLVAMIGVGSLIAQLGSLRLPRPSARRTTATADTSGRGVAELRSRVRELNSTLDDIRREDARMQSVAGVPKADTTTLLRRFLTRLPRFLRDSRPAAPVVAVRPPGDSMAAHHEAAGATDQADSLLAHASGLAGQYRALGRQWLRLDTLDVLSLRPESLQVAASSETPRVKRVGRVVEWTPTKGGALLAGFDAEVGGTREASPGHWEIDLVAPGGLVATISAPGEPTIQPGERIPADHPVMIVAGSATVPAVAVYALRRNGIALDPTVPRLFTR